MNIEERIHKVLNSKYREEWAVEGEFQVALSLTKIKDMDVYIYGAGQDIYSAVTFLKNEGIQNLKGIIDVDKRKNGQIIDEIEVFDCERLESTIQNPENTFVFIWTYCVNFRNVAIVNYLYKLGIEQYYIIKPQERYILSTIQYELAWVDADRPKYYMENENLLMSFAKKLADEESVNTLLEYLRVYIECGYYRGNNIPTRYKYFLDDNGAEIYKHLDNEVWINCGANYGDNIFLYFRNGFNCKKIYAIEADGGISSTLRENIALLPKDKSDKIEVINQFITRKSQWDFLCDETITLINADIEGAELDLLKSLQNRIKKDRPVLALCVYHLKEDLVEIPNWLNENLTDYNYYLRKYACYQGAYKGTYELVLYCVPEERTV